MDRVEAFRTLRLDQSADGRMVDSAYWTLVRQAQTRPGDDVAMLEIDRLNEAYATLSPDARPQGPPPRRMQHAAASSGAAFIDSFADWVNDEAQRTRARWPHRNPEIAIIAGAALVLMLLALSAGATVWGVFFCMALVLGAIWAPWRRPAPPSQDGE